MSHLAFDGKRLEAEILAAPGSLPDPVFTTDSGALYHGDNLPIMLGLQRSGVRAKLIYADPPFATGREFATDCGRLAYGDRLMGDEFLAWLHARLVVMRELLDDDGSIYLHLDQKQVFEAKVLMDEVFGKARFRNFITRQKCSVKHTARTRLGNVSDHIVFYSKTANFIWNRPLDPHHGNQIEKNYPYVEGTRRYATAPLHAPGVRNGETGRRWRGMSPPDGKHWQVAPERLDELDAAGEIHWSPSGNPRKKVWWTPDKTIPKQDIWLGYRDARNQNAGATGYPTEKNLAMLKTIVAASSNPGDLVLDPFCGSGAMPLAAQELGRRWLGIDLGDEAVRTTRGRFQC